MNPFAHTIETPKSGHADLDRVLNEISERLMAGERIGQDIDIEAYAAQIPDHADHLYGAIPGIQALVDLGHTPTQNGQPAPKHLGNLGDFQIIREIGRGGMGVVYEAEQISLRRKVALKVLPFAGMLDARQIARFENEARAAATVHHTNVVPIYSVGSDRKVHYYAMQFIEGMSLAEVIAVMREEPVVSAQRSAAEDGLSTDHGQLTTDQSKSEIQIQIQIQSLQPEVDTVAAALTTAHSQRPREYFRTVAEIGAQIAQGLDHAHERGVIHRDVKPANILIDGDGKPWITDFGLARIGADTGMTMSGDLLGTLRYMSPEQALAQRVVVDHRTDIYSLGVTLYELLTLAPPYTGNDRQELLKKIAFEEPRRPRQLNARIPEDLETIVCKAIEKNPADRFATAGDLVDELERFLANQPIRSRRPKIHQRAIKWSRRHQGLVATAVGVLVLLLVAVSIGAGLVWREQTRTQAALVQANEQRRAADEQKQLAMKNATRAEQSAAESKALVTFLVDDLLGALDPEHSLGESITMGEVVAEAERKVDADLQDQPLLEAAIRRAIGKLHSSMGNHQKGEEHLQKAEAIQQRLLGNAPETLETMSALAEVLEKQGRLEEARALTERTLELKRRVLGPQAPDTLREQRRLAYCLGQLGDFDLRQKVLEETLDSMRRVLGPTHLETLKTQFNLSQALMVKEWGRGGELATQTLETLRTTFGEDHPQTLYVETQILTSDDAIAKEKLKSVLAKYEHIYGPFHPLTLQLHLDFIERLAHDGTREYDEALAYCADILDRLRRELGDDHPRSLDLIFRRASLLMRKGELKESLALSEFALELSRRTRGLDHPQTLIALEQLGLVLEASEQHQRTLEVYTESVDVAKRVCGPRKFETARLMMRVGYSENNLEHYESAREVYSEALSILQEAVGEDHWSTILAHHQLGWIAMKQGEFDTARKELEVAVDRASRVWPNTVNDTVVTCNWTLANVLKELGIRPEAHERYEYAGVGRYMQGDFSGALSAFTHAVEQAEESSDRATSLVGQAMTHWCLANFDDARRVYAEAVSNGWDVNDRLEVHHASAEELMGWPKDISSAIEAVTDEISDTPDNAPLWVSRARLHAMRESWDEAAADWVKAIELSKDDSSWASRRKLATRELANDPELFRRVAESRPNDYSLWIGRGMRHAIHQQWSEAARDYARGFEMCSHDDRTILDYACVLLLSGDTSGYQKLCDDIEARADTADDVKFVCDVARSCAVGPAEGIRPEKLMAWAQRRLDIDRKPQTLHAMGLAKYRAGQFEEAIEFLMESNDGGWTDLEKSQNWLVIAMGQFRLGREKEAVDSLNQGKRLIIGDGPQHSQTTMRTDTAHEWVSILLLLREATALIEGKPLTIDELVEDSAIN